MSSIIKQFDYYRLLGQKTFDQLDEEALFRQVGEESNSIAIIVNHMSGNMLSRWTDFLISDVEKPWRERDREFDDLIKTRTGLQEKWDSGPVPAGEKSVAQTEELEIVMNNGLEFLSGLFKMTTGKDMGVEDQKIEIDKETGEVTMKFKLPTIKPKTP